jgi:hypothetical protein
VVPTFSPQTQSRPQQPHFYTRAAHVTSGRLQDSSRRAIGRGRTSNIDRARIAYGALKSGVCPPTRHESDSK